MKLFNLFKKRPLNVSIKESISIPNFCGKNYIVLQKDLPVSIQDQNDEYKIYGWIIEISSIEFNKQFYDNKIHWYNHWNHTIYHSKVVALDAINQMSHALKNHYYRITPLYKLEQNCYREYVINQIIPEN